MSRLMKRRTRGGMMAVFQDLRGCHAEEQVNLFSRAPEDRTRSNRLKIIKERSNLGLRRNFLTVRTVNQLPLEVVGCSIPGDFKEEIGQPLSQWNRVSCLSKVPSTPILLCSFKMKPLHHQVLYEFQETFRQVKY
uniref:Uncharacterized protein n=1 Tax=Micrurus spixii TaxID=129469 RepID=A0A2D4NFI9_9SAUR